MNSNQLILGLVGQIASGKGSVSKYLREKYNASFYHFSAPLRETLDFWGLEIDRKNIQKLSTFLRDNFGQDILAKKLTQDVGNDKSQIIAIDSVRRLQDIKYLEDLPNFRLLYIAADAKIRHKRLLGRGENTDDLTKTYEEFLSDQKLESELEIKKVGEMAELRINNNGSLEELHKQIDKIIQELQKH